MTNWMRAGIVAAVVAIAVAGCGSDDGDDELTVSAAASLTEAFTVYGEAFADADVQFSFGPSDDLAVQIREGAAPDVFAAANTALPEELFDDGLLEEPIVFAGNELVLAVPRDSPFDSLEGVGRPGASVVIGSEGVPVGDYTREVLSNLPGQVERSIVANVRSEEPDAKSIVGKLTQGAADAGFVYASDVTATNGELQAIELPSDIAPDVSYGIGVVTGTDSPEAASAFITGLLDGDGEDALAQAGFKPPPE